VDCTARCNSSFPTPNRTRPTLHHAQNKAKQQTKHDKPQVCFSPDGRWVLSASFDKAIKMWDGLKGTFVATFRGHVGPVYQVAWSSDSRLFVSGSKDSTLKVCFGGWGVGWVVAPQMR